MVLADVSFWSKISITISMGLAIYALLRVYLTCRDRRIDKELGWQFIILAMVVASWCIIMVLVMYHPTTPPIHVKIVPQQHSQQAGKLSQHLR